MTRARVLLVVTLVLAVGAGVFLWTRQTDAAPCGAGAQTLKQPTDPLLSPALMSERPDPHRDRLAEALSALPAPFGEVLAGVDYNYGQWLHVYGIDGGVLAWTKRNAPVTLLDPVTLKPRWALRPATKRTAWDAADGRFLLLQLSARKPTELLSVDVGTGKRQWCATLSTKNRDGDPLSTAVLDNGDVLVASGAGKQLQVQRLAGDSGQQRWRRYTSAVDRADFIGEMGDQVVIGGREEFLLADPSQKPPGQAVSAFALSDGSPQWTYSPPPGTGVHVLGVADGRLILAERSEAGLRLTALDENGQQVWTKAQDFSAYDTTLRAGVVVLETKERLMAVDAATGRTRWQMPIPTDRTFFPYGFTLAQMPSLDPDHLLVPTTTDLRILDLRTGKTPAFPLPTDGISTTYWPYQLLVTDHVLGVVTNTGAVMVARE